MQRKNSDASSKSMRGSASIEPGRTSTGPSSTGGPRRVARTEHDPARCAVRPLSHRLDLTADRVKIDHLPFFYEWTGSIDTTDVEVVLAAPTPEAAIATSNTQQTPPPPLRW